MKPLLLTGIQPTNRLTLGNYLGAIKKIIELQDKYRCFLFVADLHAFTIPYPISSHSHKEVSQSTIEIAKMYIASGINTDKCNIFIQSDVHEHLDLFYFLLTHSVVGELKRMTQYKHLSKKLTNPNGTETALTGLLIYPVLMAADILIYDTDYVSVGEDQIQHLELTRNLAKRINDKYNQQIFKLPQPLNEVEHTQPIRIKDLQDPSKKMSKSSDSYEGVIFLDDDLDTIRSKIMKAKTDSVGKINLSPEQPGITNLLNIYSLVNNMSLETAHQQLKDKTYKELKEIVADSVVKEISEIQNRYKSIDQDQLLNLLRKNAEVCRQMSLKKLDLIKSIA